MQDGRGRQPDLVGEGRVILGQGPAPPQQAVTVEAKQIAAGEQGEDALPVAHGGGSRRACLGVADRASRGPELAVPELLAGGGLETKDMQAVLGGAAGSGDIDPAIDNDGAGETAPGQVHLPGHVFGRTPANG